MYPKNRESGKKSEEARRVKMTKKDIVFYQPM